MTKPKVLALTSIHTAIEKKKYDEATMELLTLVQKEKAKPLPVEKPKVRTLAESISLVHKALNAGKYDLAIDILKFLVDTVDDPLSCPRKYRPDGFDEQAIRSMESSMRSVRTAIEEKKYGEATVELVTLYSFPMVQTPPTSVPRVFDKPPTFHEIVEMLDEAHFYAKQPYFSAAAYVIVSVIDSKVSEKDFINAAITHHLRDKRTYLEESAYKANNLFLYESVLELRPDNYLIQQIHKQCKARGGF